jgi:WD40 repeat protein
MLSPLVVPFIILAHPAGPAAPRFGNETVLMKGHPEPFASMTITADGRFLFVLDRSHRLRIRDMGKGNWRTLGIAGPEWLAVSPDGEYIFSGGKLCRNIFRGSWGYTGIPEQIFTQQTALWSTNVYLPGFFASTEAFLEGHRYPMTTAAFSANSKILVTATGKGRAAGEVKVWDVRAGQEKLPRMRYTAAAFYSPRGDDDLLGLPANLRVAPGVELLALSADGSLLATVYESWKASELGNGTAKLWDVRRGTEQGYIRIPGQRIRALTFTPDSKLLVLAVGRKGEGKVWLWDVAAGKSVAILRGHKEPAQALAVSADGKYLASACAGGEVIMWDLAKRQKLQSRAVAEVPEPAWSMAFTPDNRSLVVAGGNRRGWVKVWEMK